VLIAANETDDVAAGRVLDHRMPSEIAVSTSPRARDVLLTTWGVTPETDLSAKRI
jgi:hypothetical protein